MPKRKFEFDDSKSSKFWHIERKSNTQTVWFGKKGTKGQSNTKSFDSAAQAQASLEKLIQQKLKKGYVEIGGAKQPQTRGRATTIPSPKSSGKRAATKQTFDVARFQGFFARLRKNELAQHPKLTQRILDSAQRRLRIKFPAALVALLKIQNGGYIPDSEFKFGRQEYTDILLDIWPIRDKGGIEPLAPEYSEHLEMASGRLSKPELIFPFYGDGHFFFALDYRTNGPQQEPRVVYLDIEGKISCKKIADNFQEFLNGWQRPEIEQDKLIDIDRVDPKTILGTFSTRFMDRGGRKVKRVTCTDWLCLNGKTLEHYELYGTQGKLSNGKWNEKFGFEEWTKRSFKLSDIFSVEQHSRTKAKCFIRLNHQEVRASQGKKPVFRKMAASVVTMERTGIGKPWKTKRKKESLISYEIPVDTTQIKSCLRKLKAALK